MNLLRDNTEANFPVEEFESLFSAEDGNFWFEGRNKILQMELARLRPGFLNFLEIGCGTGFVLRGIKEKFPSARLFGSEYFSEGLRYAKLRLPDATFFRINALHIPFKDEFEVIGLFDVLEHIKDDAKVLSGVAKALRPNGIALVTVPQHDWLWSDVDAYSGHVRRYNRGELVDKARAVGLEPVRVTSFVSFLLPPMYVSRLLNRAQGPRREAAKSTGLALPTSINSLFGIAMNVERLVLRMGASLPIGGSLFAAFTRSAHR